jgi:hypothetical protein
MTSLVKAAGSARPTRPRELTEIAQKVVVSRMSEAAVIHISDGDEPMRAALDSLLRSTPTRPTARST